MAEARKIKWSQWSPGEGMIRCGEADYRTLMTWMVELGRDAKKCLDAQEKSHAIYGRVLHDGDGLVTEFRFYCDTYCDDEELDEHARHNPYDTFYVVHKS